MDILKTPGGNVGGFTVVDVKGVKQYTDNRLYELYKGEKVC